MDYMEDRLDKAYEIFIVLLTVLTGVYSSIVISIYSTSSQIELLNQESSHLKVQYGFLIFSIFFWVVYLLSEKRIYKFFFKIRGWVFAIFCFAISFFYTLWFIYVPNAIFLEFSAPYNLFYLSGLITFFLLLFLEQHYYRLMKHGEIKISQKQFVLVSVLSFLLAF